MKCWFWHLALENLYGGMVHDGYESYGVECYGLWIMVGALCLILISDAGMDGKNFVAGIYGNFGFRLCWIFPLWVSLWR